MKKRIEKELLKIAKTVGERDIRNRSRWPPICSGILYQPIYPRKLYQLREKDVSNEYHI